MTRVSLLAALMAASTTFACTTTEDLPPPDVSALADEYLAEWAAYDPLEARLWGVEASTAQLIKPKTQIAIADWEQTQREMLRALARVDADTLTAAESAVYINLRDKLEANLALRACRQEYWPLNHAAGWHLNILNSAGNALGGLGGVSFNDAFNAWGEQIVKTIEVERENLEAGLRAGYSTPRGIALQVAQQYAQYATKDGPFYGVAGELPPEMAQAWVNALDNAIAPAFREYADYIENSYAPRARTERSLKFIPTGKECYLASIRHQIGVEIQPDELRAQVQAHNKISDGIVKALGKERFGVASVKEAFSAAKAVDPQLVSEQTELLSSAQEISDGLIEASAYLFPELPPNTVEVRLFPQSQWGTVDARYQPDFSKGYHGVYYIDPTSNRAKDLSSLRWVTGHEVAPGHHMQAMVARHYGANVEGQAKHQILTVGFVGAFVEGWATYAEMLAYEEGIIVDPVQAILFWADHNKRLDLETRFHAGELDDIEAAKAVLALRGDEDDELSAADNFLDWMAVMPAQIISYEVGGNFILGLRDKAKAALEDKFDYPTFHRLILEEGSVPLWRLEQKIDAWISSEQDA